MGEPPPILFQRLSAAATLPVRAHPEDAGLDLASAEDLELAPGARAAVATGLAMAVPQGHAGLVLPRSGRALREGLTVANSPGLIDSGYRGELKVILINLGGEAIRVAVGERIAQLVLVPISLATAALTETLPVSDGREAGGFGSTG